MNKKCTTICFFGARKSIDTGMVSLNLAAELVNRNHKVVFGNSIESDNDYSYMVKDINRQDKDIDFIGSTIEGLKILSFSKHAVQLSPEKIEKLVIDLPEAINGEGDFFLFNVKDPFNFPDRYILLHTDIHVIVAKADSSVFSDIFQLLEKFIFLPAKPSTLYIVFNEIRDMESAFNKYLDLLNQSEELKMDYKFHFLGIMPSDILRQSFSSRLGLPVRVAFPDSPVRGAVSFMADKITGLSGFKEKEEVNPVLALKES